MKKWKCTVCGYVHEGDEPPEVCPVCGADRSLFELVEETPPSGEHAQAEKVEKEVTAWKCGVCGYVHEGSTPPETCPVCGAEGALFEPVGETSENAAPATLAAGEKPEEETEGAGGEAPPGGKEGEAADPAAGPGTPYERLAVLMHRYHAHPIAVHIPNGVLPVSMLFVVLSMLFGSEGLATAAICNLVVVALAMPLVLFTGYTDWQRAYGGHLTRVFQIKIVCGGTVALIAPVLCVWWAAAGNPLAAGSAGRGFFLFLCLALLAAAVTAGYQGGKLVFPARK